MTKYRLRAEETVESEGMKARSAAAHARKMALKVATGGNVRCIARPLKTGR